MITPEVIEALRRLDAAVRDRDGREASDLVDIEDVLEGRHG